MLLLMLQIVVAEAIASASSDPTAAQLTNMGATTQEEIAKQHSIACKIIQSNKPCISRINHGEVPLSWKLQPTCTLKVDGVDDNGGESSGIKGKEGDEEERGIEVVNVDYPTWCVSSRKLLITFDVFVVLVFVAIIMVTYHIYCSIYTTTTQAAKWMYHQ